MIHDIAAFYLSPWGLLECRYYYLEVCWFGKYQSTQRRQSASTEYLVVCEVNLRNLVNRRLSNV